MKSKEEIRERLIKLSTEEGRKYDEELCAWYDDHEREIRIMELQWILYQ